MDESKTSNALFVLDPAGVSTPAQVPQSIFLNNDGTVTSVPIYSNNEGDSKDNRSSVTNVGKEAANKSVKSHPTEDMVIRYRIKGETEPRNFVVDHNVYPNWCKLFSIAEKAKKTSNLGALVSLTNDRGKKSLVEGMLSDVLVTYAGWKQPELKKYETDGTGYIFETKGVPAFKTDLDLDFSDASTYTKLGFYFVGNFHQEVPKLVIPDECKTKVVITLPIVDGKFADTHSLILSFFNDTDTAAAKRLKKKLKLESTTPINLGAIVRYIAMRTKLTGHEAFEQANPSYFALMKQALASFGTLGISLDDNDFVIVDSSDPLLDLDALSLSLIESEGGDVKIFEIELRDSERTRKDYLGIAKKILIVYGIANLTVVTVDVVKPSMISNLVASLNRRMNDRFGNGLPTKFVMAIVYAAIGPGLFVSKAINGTSQSSRKKQPVYIDGSKNSNNKNYKTSKQQNVNDRVKNEFKEFKKLA